MALLNYENHMYYYLLDKHEHTNVKFCVQDGEELVEVNDKVLVTKLLPLFVEASKDEIPM